MLLTPLCAKAGRPLGDKSFMTTIKNAVAALKLPGWFCWPARRLGPGLMPLLEPIERVIN